MLTSSLQFEGSGSGKSSAMLTSSQFSEGFSFSSGMSASTVNGSVVMVFGVRADTVIPVL